MRQAMCGDCKGYGRALDHDGGIIQLPNGESMACGECGGSGVATSFDRAEPCRECAGDGCSACMGSGLQLLA